jgi:hypothetical protein
MLHERLTKVAGEGAKDCGFSESEEADTPENSCALQSLHSKEPFIIQYRLVGIDSVLQRGFALNSKGQFFMVDGFWRVLPNGKLGDLIYECKNIPEVASMENLHCDDLLR